MYDEEDLETTNGAWRAVDGRFWELPHKRVPAPGAEDHLTLVRLLTRAQNGNPIVALQAVVALRRRVSQLERFAVELAKSSGWSWRDVGDILGLSRSAAHRRYRQGL
jgi:hypothetical protein